MSSPAGAKIVTVRPSESTINQAGDFIFVPTGLPHQPINLSTTERAMAIVARDDTDEQEIVSHYDPHHLRIPPDPLDPGA